MRGGTARNTRPTCGPHTCGVCGRCGSNETRSGRGPYQRLKAGIVVQRTEPWTLGNVRAVLGPAAQTLGEELQRDVALAQQKPDVRLVVVERGLRCRVGGGGARTPNHGAGTVGESRTGQ